MNNDNWKDLFQLDPSIHFLNFGSFGACPQPIFDEYQLLQRELEKDPVQFITSVGPKLLNESLNSLSHFLNCSSEDLIFTPNPTYAINLVIQSLNLDPGDEILTTNLEYGAMDYTWQHYAMKRGWNYIRQSISLPLTTEQKIEEEFWKGWSPKTKVVFISQITSSTALILPVKKICAEAKKRGLICIVDGAHVPGHIPLDLTELDVDYYTGACHKWLMTPKGCSFLHVKNSKNNPLEPLIVSWGYHHLPQSSNRFQELHQFVGTNDFTAYLTLPKALSFRTEMKWDEHARISQQRTLEWAPVIAEVLSSRPLAPLNENFIGQMASFPISTPEPIALKTHLYMKYRLQLPIMEHHGQIFLRYSIQPFVEDTTMEYLVNTLKTIRRETALIS